jgi:beta-xylosidase
VASYAVFQVDTWEDAVYWTTRFLEVLGEGEVELRPIFEPTDLPPDIFPPEAAAHEATVRAEMQRNASR